jgi:CheY-like chemotaxis protein/HPt (histidine-containing phosphotransfer) domain-containing protein
MRLRQILFNLLSNALKFVEAGKGKVVLHVQVYTHPDGRQLVRFRVVDNGIGMSQDMVGKLFQAFTQADESTARKYGGTGLGLSITQRLVKLLQGEIRVKSELGLGSEFSVELPLQAAPPGQLPLHTPLLAEDATGIPSATSSNSNPLTLAAPAGAEALVSRRLILLAEDNEINREVMHEQLSRLGCHVEMAEDGEVALTMWRSGRYALLLTDCQMPKLDGYGLAAAIRQAEPAGVRLPIIAVTANAMSGEKEHCLQCGMDDLLSKPFRLEQLRSLLEKWLPLVQETTTAEADSAHSESAAKANVHVAAQFPVWDAEVLPRMLGDKPALHRQLLDKYLIDAQERVTTILDAAQEGDMLKISRTAHALKSLARVVGVMQLGEVSQELEALGKAPDAQGCQLVVNGLQAVFDLGADEIRRHLAENL